MRGKVVLISGVVLISFFIVYFYFFLPVPSFEIGNERLYIKEVQNNDVKLDWFFYSAAYSESPDYITVNQGGTIDTICTASNIAGLRLDADKIMLGFYGSPQLYGEPIEVPTKVMGYKVLIDTNYVRDSHTNPRKFYLK